MGLSSTIPMVAPGPQGLRAISNQLEKTMKQIVSSSTGWNPNDWERLPQWEDALDAAVGSVSRQGKMNDAEKAAPC